MALIEFQPGVFVRRGETVSIDGTRWRFDGLKWRALWGAGDIYDNDPPDVPPELRSRSTGITRPVRRGDGFQQVKV